MASNRKRVLRDEEIAEMLDENDDFTSSGSDYDPDSESSSSSLHSSESGSSDLQQANVSDSEDDGDIYDQTEWTEEDGVPKIHTFTGQEGFTVHIPPTSSPSEIFTLLFDPNILDNIVLQTNKRANYIIENTEFRRRSAMKLWRNTTADEMKIFISLTLLMGHVRMPTMKHYWSKKNILYNHPIFGKVMKRERFKLILKCLHFFDPERADTTDRLHKIILLKPIIDNIRQIYYPGKELSLDEAILLWRGRLIFRQYIPGKRHKYGIKFYELCTPDGYILNIMLYTGKGTVKKKTEGESHAEGVVLKLMENHLGKGHVLYMDNFYNSIKLTKILGKRRTHVVGTLRKNRKGLPEEVTKAKLKKGEAIWKRSGNIIVQKWKDKKDVLMISSKHRHEMVETTNRRMQMKMKPSSIAEYNKYMSGIDRSDQMLAYYPTPRKSIRWYIKVFFHYIDVCVWNSCWIYNKTHARNKTYLQFREAVILEFMNAGRQGMGLTPLYHLPCSQQNLPNIQNNKDHNIQKLQKRKRCRNCSKQSKRTDSWYECDTCLIGLCATPCFKEWHAQQHT